jgi:hypothetical protein
LAHTMDSGLRNLEEPLLAIFMNMDIRISTSPEGDTKDLFKHWLDSMAVGIVAGFLDEVAINFIRRIVDALNARKGN